MKRIASACVSIAWLACLGLVLLADSGARAQEPMAEHYDTSTPVTLTGTVKLILYSAPPTPASLLIERQEAGGKPELWIIVGHPARVLQRSGWRPELLNGGQTVTISAYRPKARSKAPALLVEMLEAEERAGSFVDELKKPEPRLAYGFEIRLKDGTKLAFGERQ